jgi:hypothetical protein
MAGKILSWLIISTFCDGIKKPSFFKVKIHQARLPVKERL